MLNWEHKKKIYGLGGCLRDASILKSTTVLAKDLSYVTITHIRQFITEWVLKIGAFVVFLILEEMLLDFFFPHAIWWCFWLAHILVLLCWDISPTIATLFKFSIVKRYWHVFLILFRLSHEPWLFIYTILYLFIYLHMLNNHCTTCWTIIASL